MTDELLEQFVIEGRELVQQASDDLLGLERDPLDTARVDSAFRAVHTLKGSAGLFDFAPMSRALHAAEDVLGAMRDGGLAVTGGVIDALLGCVALAEDWVEAVARDGRLPDGAQLQGQASEQALRAVQQADGADAARAAGGAADGAAAGDGEPPGWLAAALRRQADRVAAAQAAGQRVVAARYVPNADCFFLGDDPLALVRAVPAVISLHIAPREAWSAAEFDPFHCNLVIEVLSTAPIDAVQAMFRFVADQVLVAEATAGVPGNGGAETARSAGAPAEKPVGAAIGAAAGARPLRVDAARIDALMDIVGQLMVASNGYGHLARQAAGTNPGLAQALGANVAQIDRLVGDLHGAVMRVRMTPLSRTFRRLPRLVREIAAMLGKTVAFDISGEELEADRTIVDGLFEPLLHVLRNAIDHGVETAAARAASGKPAGGRITLDARREGDRVVIAVSDDGAGIDRDRVRATALARGLMDAAALQALDDQAVLELVFAPGFSTAAAVTQISGRGVGMDAVRTTVEALGGRVRLTSEPSAGSAILLSMPQAVLITTVMTVRVGQERFGIPIETVAETALVAADRILPIRDGEAFILRDRTVPLLQLATLLQGAAPPGSGAGSGRRSDAGARTWDAGQGDASLGAVHAQDCKVIDGSLADARSADGKPPAAKFPGRAFTGGKAADAKILIALCGEHRVGVEVDGFDERTDVLVRPLTGLLAGMSGMLGAALLGDGSVLMVLDLPELIG